MNHPFRRISTPEYIIIATSSVIFLSLTLFYLIDLRNFLGLRDILWNANPAPYYFTYRPFFFHHYGKNAGIAEILQWTLLAVTAGISFYQAGKYHLKDKVLNRFFLLFAISITWMLVEDAGDVRQTIMSYVQAAAGENDQGLFGTLFEGVYFVAIAVLPLFALYKARYSLRKIPRALGYLSIGLALRYLAGGLSFIGTAFDLLIDQNLYTQWGQQLILLSYRIGDSALQPLWESWNLVNWNYPIGFFLLDSLIEENIELLGNAFFLAGIMYLLKIVQRKNSDSIELE